jgi:cytochrome c oxidase subunit 2
VDAVPGLTPALVDTRHQYYRVFDVYVPIAIAVVAIVFLSALFLLIKNRRRLVPTRTHENNPIELSYAVFLTLIVAGLLYVTFSSEHQTDSVAYHEKASVVVNVTAARWEWDFYYPAFGFHVISGTTGEKTLVVPANEAVEFRLRSVDVIHAFWIPSVRYKHDNTPGSTQVIKLVFPKTGLSQGECAEYCGLRHADMVFFVRVVSPAQFERWGRSGGKAALT